MKLAVERDKKAPRFVAWMYECMEAMLPTLEEYQVAIGLENLPTWEALPSETEIEALCNHFDSPYVRAWWDMGHAQIRENLGYINHERWMTKLHPLIVGLHVHDVSHKIADHTMPPLGEIDFSRFATLGAWFDEHAETDNLPPAPPGESAEASTGTESENKTPTEQA
jgi:sugar phosphate isomerase/epimerase